jgi:dephospho-CoA kinase
MYGLTGSIATGKSTVAAMLKEKGAVILDADQISREVVEVGTPGWKQVVEAFPEAVREDGALDRKKLGRIIFADAEKRQQLEAIIHPLVLDAIKTRGTQLKQRGQIVFADTAITKPSSADVTAISTTPITAAVQFTPLRFMKKAAKMTGTKALNIPNKTAPKILAKTSTPILSGAISRRSNERPFLSKVIVTASIEVVPNKTLMAIKPGSSSSTPVPPPERINCISVQDRGKTIPQLIFGGFK